MANASMSAALRQVCGWAARGTDAHLPDPQLLERFISQRDEAAFAALIQRHGGLVLSVVRRILHDANAAEDVFQNTFLTLARHAGSIRKGGAIAAWLYGVAARLATQTRVRDRRRAAREREANPPTTAEDVAEATAWRELGTILDEELLYLPERYRAPLVLIYFAGQTQEEAARQLGWSKGTLRRRLEGGKHLLHGRLLRRGVSLSVGLLAAGLSQHGIEAALPPSLVARTVRQAVGVACGEMVFCSAGASSLIRAKLALALGLLIAGGAGVAALQSGKSEPLAERREQSAPPPAQATKQLGVDRFGDPLPPGAIARLGTMRLRHGNGTSVVFSADGKSLLTCGGDLTVRTWELTSGRLLREQHLPRTSTSSPVAVLSPDGRYVAFEKLFNTLRLWDLRADKLRHEFPSQGTWPRVLFSPDSKWLVIADADGALHVRDVDTGKSRSLGRHGKRIESLSFTGDGTLMSLADDKMLRFWNVKEGRERSRLTLSEPVPSAAVSPDGRNLAVTTHWDKDKSVRFWDAATGKAIKGWKDWDAPALRDVPYVQFTPDGKTVLIGTEDGILVWDPLAGKCIHTLPGRRVFNFAFSPDGKMMASLGGPIGGGFLMESVARVWDLTTGKPHAANRPENGHLNPANALAFSPDGCTLVSASRVHPDASDVRLWDTATGRPLRSPPVKGDCFFQTLPFTPDGRELLLGSDSAIVRWEIATGREVRRYSLGKKGKTNPDVTVVQLCDDGRTLLALDQHANGKANAKPPGNSDYALHAWDLATGERLRSVPLAVEEPRINCSHFSPDGRLFAIPSGSIRDTMTGAEVARLSVADKSLESPIAFSLDGALIAMSVRDESKRDGITSWEVAAIQVWETATLAPMARLATGPVAHIAFTPDGRRLIAAGPDALALWDISSGEVIVRRPAPGRFQGTYGPSFASSLAVAADGRTVATGNADTTILLWDLSPPASEHSTTALTAAEREACWTDLAGGDAGRALRAIVRLTDEPEQTARMLRERLHPVKAPSAEELRRLIADLDDARFDRREAATKRLAELGELAQTALREALQRKPALEVRRRIENLLTAARRVQAPEDRRHLRGVRILEAIGTRPARQVLEMLAQGASEARLTREANASLARLARRAKP